MLRITSPQQPRYACRQLPNQEPVARRRQLRRWFRWLIAGLAGLSGIPFLLMISWRWIPPPTSAFMLNHQLERLLTDQSKAPPLHYAWTALEQISPQVLLAVIAAEDQRFPDHFGLDFRAIELAAAHNARSGRLRGASTITQQTAKNLFLWSGRSYVRKTIEAGLAVCLELLWGKRRILEVYVNIAEFGDGIYGIGAAAERYFSKPPARLTRQEAALIAAVLPSPGTLHPNRPSPYLKARAFWILRQMDRLGGRTLLERLGCFAYPIQPRVTQVNTR